MRVAPIMLLSVATSWSTAACGQEPQYSSVASVPECVQCVIRAEEVATIGVVDGPGYLAEMPVSMARDSRGNIYVVVAGGIDLPSVYDSTGAFIRRLGRMGSGPGEYRSPTTIALGTNDTVYVYDIENRRVTVLTPDFEVARTQLTPGAAASSTLFYNDGTVIMNALMFNDYSRIGYPLHILSNTGDILRSFGTDRPRYREDRPQELIRVLAASGSASAFWAGEMLTYRLTLWGRDGQPLRVIERNAEWFPPMERTVGVADPAKTPTPSFRAIREHTDGLLWTAVATAEEDWQRGRIVLGPLHDGQRAFARNPSAVYDTRIEVFDPSRGRLIAAETLSPFIAHFLSDDLAVELFRDDDAVSFARIWRLTLEGR